MRQTHHATAVIKAALTVLVALFLAVRVVAQPLVLSAPEPGLMALCAGGKIVYVSVETGEPVETERDGATLTDSCPFFGVTAFDLADPKAAPGPVTTPARSVHALEAQLGLHSGGTLHNGARAPPAQG